MTGVLIVGAGPTGLTLACELARRNVPFEIIDHHAGAQVGSRDRELHPRSLDVLDDLGVLDAIMQAGGTSPPLRLHQPGRPAFDLRTRSDLVTIPQWQVEQLLRIRLAMLGARVRFGVELAGFVQERDAVRATLSYGGKGEEIARYAYLVGCDGSHSTVRAQLGLAAHARDEPYVLVSDVTLDGLCPDRAHVWLDDDGHVSITPLPGSDSWQLQATVTDPWPEPGLRDLGALLHGRCGATLTGATWLSGYRLQSRALDRYRYRRVLLAGDAAHTHGAAGGQGMNTGIQDAHNLGWKLAGVLGGADPVLLDSYSAERSGAARALRDRAASGARSAPRQVARHPAVLRRLLACTAELDIAYPCSPISRPEPRARHGGPVAGDRAPNARCQSQAPSTLAEAFRGTHWTLLGFGADALDALSAVKAVQPVHCYPIASTRRGAPRGALVSREAYGRYRARPGTLVLVRPDGYVALRTSRVAEVLDYLTRLYPCQTRTRVPHRRRLSCHPLPVTGRPRHT